MVGSAIWLVATDVTGDGSGVGATAVDLSSTDSGGNRTSVPIGMFDGSAIRVPTLVIWGEDDKLDPVSTGEELHKRLTCEKKLIVVPGNGHVGHLDRNRHEVFRVTSDWLSKHLGMP